MHIEKLDNSVTEQIIDLILPIQQQEFGVNVTLADQPDLLDIEQYYLQNGGVFLGAFIGKKLVGTIAYLNMGHDAVALRKMFVNKSFRGKELGIGQKLLEEIEIICQESDIQYIYLGTVDQLKAAHRFYEKNGFERIEKNSLPSYFPLMEVDTIFYKKDLKNEQGK